jgi:hypothetical protein
VAWREASGTGVLYSYSIARQASDWPAADLPLIVAYVELAEGPRVMTNVLECEPEVLSVGMPVEARYIPTDEADVAIPVFAPREGSDRE